MKRSRQAYPLHHIATTAALVAVFLPCVMVPAQAKLSEIHTEQMAAALRPLSGMNAAQYATAGRRGSLAPAAQRECRQLEPDILGLEQEERSADASTVRAIQQDLFALRKRYKILAC